MTLKVNIFLLYFSSTPNFPSYKYFVQIDKIFDALRNLVSFVQFKKSYETPMEEY